MKKLLLICVAVLVNATLFSQENTYEITNNADVQSVNNYEIALNDADFDAYRFLHERRKLVFRSGVVVELLSVDELQVQNIAVDATKAINKENFNSKNEIMWVLTENKKITALYKSPPTKPIKK